MSKHSINNFFILCIILLCLDFVYLNLIKKMFAKQILDVQKSQMQINYFGAALCYFILTTGFNHFIIKQNKTKYDAFLLGLMVYGVYETTNYALLKNWSPKIVVIDTLWGGILFVLTKIVYDLVMKNKQ